MLVILVLLSMMAGGHQQSCLRSLIRHRPHKYWHRFGLTHTYTLCKSETHMKALCTCGGRQPKRESISLQTVHISLLYFFTAIIHCIVPYTPIYEPGQISNWEQIFLIKTHQTFLIIIINSNNNKHTHNTGARHGGVNTQFSGLSLH